MARSEVVECKLPKGRKWSDKEVIKEAGYEVVEIPVLDHCDDEILKEFL